MRALCFQSAWTEFPLCPPTRCATLGKLLSLSVARFPSLFKSTGANNDSSLPGGCKD